MRAEHDESWRKELRAARRALKVTIPEVARAASLSIETVRGYENGRRTPTREHLIHVLQAINLPFMESNAILNAAGFAALRTRFPEDDFPEYFFVRGELDAAVERVPWPEFVAGDLLEVVAANRAAEAIWGIDFQHEKRTRTRAQLNLLSVASDHHFADRVGNWDEIVEFMASLYKGVPSGETLDRPSTFFNDVLAEFAKGDPAFLASLGHIWSAAKPVPPKVRQWYRIDWIDPEFGTMRFLGIISTCSEPDALAFNDWHPFDAETWRVLEQVKARAAAEKGNGRLTAET